MKKKITKIDKEIMYTLLECQLDEKISFFRRRRDYLGAYNAMLEKQVALYEFLEEGKKVSGV